MWGVLEQLIEKLKTDFPITQLSRSVCILYILLLNYRAQLFVICRSREERSASVDNTNSIGLLSLLQKALNNLQANSHQKQTNPDASTTAPTSQPPTPVSEGNTEQNVKEEEIGRVDNDRCSRCEHLVGEEVCGANGKTYVSLCHAVNCAGLRESDITAGRCIEEVVN